MSTTLTNPKAISEAGERIYDRLYRAEYEKRHLGKFVAIDITTETATLGATSSEVLADSRNANRKGLFHLIRIGHPAAFVRHTIAPSHRNIPRPPRVSLNQ
jgi:hypothetical protein